MARRCEARSGAALVLVAAFAMTGCASALERDPETGELLEGGELDVFELLVGDCVAEFAEDSEVSRIRAVPCSAPHTDEVYTSARLPNDGDWPGEDAVADFAHEACVADFADFIGVAWEDSELTYRFLAPTETSWANGDREVLCTVTDPDAAVTGSLEGAAR